MNPADAKAVLLEAADYLDKLADEAQYRGTRFVVDVAGPVADVAWLGPTHDVLTATRKQAELVRAVSRPLAVRMLARSLRTEAESLDEVDEHLQCTDVTCPTMAACNVAVAVLRKEAP